MIVIKFVAVVIIAYLLGSIPVGLIVSKLTRGVDVRQHGSGKTGATNVMRTTGTKLGVLTLLLDVAKAVVAVILAKVIVGDALLPLAGGIYLNWQIAQVMAGLAVVAGHNWPIFAKFKGGRGVTTFFGAMFAIYPPAAVLGTEVLAAVALHSRRMSLGSILGITATLCLMIPLTIAYNLPPVYLTYASICMVLVVYQHRDNIKRLKHGTEPQLF